MRCNGIPLSIVHYSRSWDGFRNMMHAALWALVIMRHSQVQLSWRTRALYCTSLKSLMIKKQLTLLASEFEHKPMAPLYRDNVIMYYSKAQHCLDMTGMQEVLICPTAKYSSSCCLPDDEVLLTLWHINMCHACCNRSPETFEYNKLYHILWLCIKAVYYCCYLLIFFL